MTATATDTAFMSSGRNVVESRGGSCRVESRMNANLDVLARRRGPTSRAVDRLAGLHARERSPVGRGPDQIATVAVPVGS